MVGSAISIQNKRYEESDDSIIDFKYKAKVSHLARLLQILTDTYGIPKNMNALKGMEGSEVSAFFPKLGKRYATIKISNCCLYPIFSKAEKPVATIIFNLESDEIVPVINDVIKTPANLLGITKLVFKYVVTGKIKLRGSLFKALTIIKTIMLGKHPMYQKEKEYLNYLKGLEAGLDDSKQ